MNTPSRNKGWLDMGFPPALIEVENPHVRFSEKVKEEVGPPLRQTSEH